jgi:hypothetical protein
VKKNNVFICFVNLFVSSRLAMARVKRGNKVKKQTTGNSVAKSGFKKSRGKQSAATTGLKRAGVVRDARLKIIAKNR